MRAKLPKVLVPKAMRYNHLETYIAHKDSSTAIKELRKHISRTSPPIAQVTTGDLQTSRSRGMLPS